MNRVTIRTTSILDEITAHGQVNGYNSASQTTTANNRTSKNNKRLNAARKASITTLQGTSKGMSNGAYFWDGADIAITDKSDCYYNNHRDWGIYYKDIKHDIYETGNLLHEPITKYYSLPDGKKGGIQGAYTHMYDSTAAYGGTVFWKKNIFLIIMLFVDIFIFAQTEFLNFYNLEDVAYEQIEYHDGFLRQEDIENYIKNIILNKKGYEDRTFLYAKKLKSFNPAIEIWLYFLEEENFDMGYFLLYKNNILQNQKYEDFKGLIWSDSSFKHIFNYEDSTLEKQIEKFRCGRNTVFIYDFNHDGTDEILSFSNDTTINIGINSISIFGEFKWLLSVENPLPIERTMVEFIIYKGRRGIKICAFNYEIEKNQWTFYYYDRIQQKYVQDENAPSEELELLHGSPDFFAEAGIDYMKLERPLLPADLEGFSKPALRIWRNAIYARHGRTFKSEDLQALFNEYAWYKPDEDYSDDKLSDIDIGNLKLIQKFEK